MGERTIRVWDPAVRVFHWGLVTAVTVAWLTGDEWGGVHEWAGYVVAGLIGFRLLWGLVGPRYARFTQFVRPPGTVLRYIADMASGRERRHLGHNPAGAAMIVVLLLTLAGTALTGWMYTLDAFWGVEWVEETHAFLANSLLVLIGLHVAGVVLASVRHGENLARAMVIGRKREPSGEDVG
ncbi:hypothetical protein KBTX_03478 [wastewater metagenome]|uniref:Cytochrome b561 bacterial/Ni-hydrogenase domain-containing protein n=2 Tax=unclassified sequences TaxID=12908 RepID=A0A5B8RGH2_9ZZZZ|nr:cytochrome b/b6 domain-containing protein [Arhodomonas sp. KWT]QEA07133.1 hypothetical protein KBTEX_03478 [uncultured organism]